jgi:hypothetical protein
MINKILGILMVVFGSIKVINYNKYYELASSLNEFSIHSKEEDETSIKVILYIKNELYGEFYVQDTHNFAKVFNESIKNKYIVNRAVFQKNHWAIYLIKGQEISKITLPKIVKSNMVLEPKIIKYKNIKVHTN